MDIKALINKIKDIDTKALIETLKSVDVKDLKNINGEQIKRFVQSRLDIVINGTLILITFLAIMNISGGHKKKATKLKKEVGEMQENFKAFKAFKDVQKKQKNFIKIFPQALSSNQLIDEVFALASKHNIQILSFSPLQEKSDDFAKFTRVNISLSLDNYADVVRFIHDIENTNYSIQVEKWEFVQDSRQDKEIKVNLVIGSVKLKK